jgi:hypothetical protein
MERHGLSGTPTYRSWMSMHMRCAGRQSDPARYQGRGITICDRWASFTLFYEDMGGRPEGTSLDRIDSAGNYEPSNCRWATKAEQARNKSNTVRLTLGDRSMCMAEWSRELGLSPMTLHKRIKKGWPIDMVLSPRIFHERKGQRHQQKATT